MVPPTALSSPDADGRGALSGRHRWGEPDAHRLAGVSQLQPDQSHGRSDGTACVLQNRKVRLPPRCSVLGETEPSAARLDPILLHDIRLLLSSCCLSYFLDSRTNLGAFPECGPRHLTLTDTTLSLLEICGTGEGRRGRFFFFVPLAACMDWLFLIYKV